MPKRLFTVDDPYGYYSEIIDVRTPDEFIEDHIPGSINLPVLSNEERKIVGTVYKQENPFRGRKLGAGIVAANIGTMLKGHFCTKEEGYHPLVYCWRGGQRSRGLATILSEIGWEVSLLRGGYKRYRALVREQLGELPMRFAYLVLSGLTGSAKSKLLEILEREGEQVLHLERLAKHQGSLLGAYVSEPQPTQKLFESETLSVLRKFSPKSVVWVEAESQKIGEVYTPRVLRERMFSSHSIFISVPIEARVRYLIREYPHFIAHPAMLKDLVGRLIKMHSHERVKEWVNDIDAGNWDRFVEGILLHHYDPRYGKALSKNYGRLSTEYAMNDLSEACLLAAASDLRALARDILGS